MNKNILIIAIVIGIFIVFYFASKDQKPEEVPGIVSNDDSEE